MSDRTPLKEQNFYDTQDALAKICSHATLMEGWLNNLEKAGGPPSLLTMAHSFADIKTSAEQAKAAILLLRLELDEARNKAHHAGHEAMRADHQSRMLGIELRSTKAHYKHSRGEPA